MLSVLVHHHQQVARVSGASRPLDLDHEHGSVVLYSTDILSSSEANATKETFASK